MINVILIIVLIVLALATGAVTVLLINRNRVRLTDDPMLSAHGDQPGFSAEQFRRFRSAVHDPRKPDHRVRA